MAGKRQSGRQTAATEQIPAEGVELTSTDEDLILLRYLQITYPSTTFTLERIRDLPEITRGMVLAHVRGDMEELKAMTPDEMMMKLYGQAWKPHAKPIISPEDRTRPMTIREAARLMGYARTHSRIT